MNLKILMFTIIASILFGFVAVAISFRLQRKYELNYVKSYFYHQVLILLFGFYGLLGTITAHFFLTDIKQNSEIISLLLSFLPFIGAPFMIAAWYMFIRISFEMVERKISLKFTLWFFITVSVVFLLFGFLVPYIDYFTVDQARINTHVFLFFILFELLTLILVFYNYFIFSRSLKERFKVRFIKLFAVINLLFYILSVFFLILGENKSGFIGGYIMVYFFKDIIPLLLLGHFLNKNYIHPANVVSEDTRESFVERFGISKRESEIIDELIQGRTNKEISERLFISLQTVKDHIHNIFLKTEVKNRVQLTNLMREFKFKK